MTQAVLTSPVADESPAPTPAAHLAIPAAVMPSGPLARLDPLVRAAFDPADTLADAEAYTRRLANGHYENFSVVSLLLPRHLRQDFCNVYAFCRLADDLGDELADARASLDELAQLRDLTHAAYAGRAGTNLFVALADTIRRHSVPIEPFLDLISAFEQDQAVVRYETFPQLVDYCARSANPVGRLVLYTCGYRDAERQRLSDQTCTALQLINFWQDVRRDLLDRDRIYLPADSMRQFGVTEAAVRDQIARGRCDDNFRRLLQFEVGRAESMFAEGRKLLPTLRPAVRGQIGLFGAGGLAILHAIRRQNYDTLARRPVLSRLQKGRLVLTALAAAMGRALGDLSGASRRGGSPTGGGHE